MTWCQIAYVTAAGRYVAFDRGLRYSATGSGEQSMLAFFLRIFFKRGKSISGQFMPHVTVRTLGHKCFLNRKKCSDLHSSQHCLSVPFKWNLLLFKSNIRWCITLSIRCRQDVHFSRFSKVAFKLFRCRVLVNYVSWPDSVFAVCKVRYKVLIDGLLISNKSRASLQELNGNECIREIIITK